MKAHPNVEITVPAAYAQAGLLRDVTPVVNGTDFGNSMAPGVWEVYNHNGKVYGAPNDMGCITFWYNKDLLAKVGDKTFPADWNMILAFLTLAMVPAVILYVACQKYIVAGLTGGAIKG